jgi:sulfite exporter TauE/SafE
MTQDATTLTALLATAAGIGFVHTLFGPDHYLPFIVMSESGKWSLRKTGVVTFLCGLGHVMSSVVLGFIGVILGIAIGKLEAFEGLRGDLAAWALMTFGFLYMIWGVKRAIRNKPHTHPHLHADGSVHAHSHSHEHNHVHVHATEGRPNLTPWVLFTVFVLGPCEPLIPILMYPAAKESLLGTALVTGVFAFFTIATMMTVVMLGSLGLTRLPTRLLERYTHAIAGGTIALCGAAIVFLGL